jgi:uridylate kinase
MPKLMLSNEKTLVLSVGGSLIVPNGGPDAKFIGELKKFVLREVKKGRRLAIVVGGGKTARHYIDAANQVGKIDKEDLDWLGIHSTRLNAHLIRTVLRDIAHPVVVKDSMKAPKVWKGKVLIGAGEKPGQSTDHAASRLAHRLGVRQVLNFSNIDHVYDKDPNKFKNAEPLEQLTWSEYRKMVGNKWTPGMSAPFDPIASKYCQKHKIEVAIAAWEKKNVSNVLAGKEFVGTMIF